MQLDRRHRHAAREQPHQRAVGERPSGAGHLGAAGPVGVHVLEVAERPRALRRRSSAPGSRARRGRPTRSTNGSGRARQSRCWSGGALSSTRSRTPPGSRSTSPVSGSAGPDPSGSRSSTTQLPSSSSVETWRPQRPWSRGCGGCWGPDRPDRRLAGHVERRRQRRAGVDDQQVAGVEVLDQVAGPGMGDTAGRGDGEAHAVARETPCLGWHRRVAAGGQVEAGADALGVAGVLRVGGGHAPTPSRSAARCRPPGRSSTSSRTSAGTAVSGRGRSEMSSPGKAAWCMAVRRSPGSTLCTRSGGLLGGQDRGGVVERGLRRPVAAPAVVGLDGGVGGEVEDPPVLAAQLREQVAHQRHRCDDVDGQDLGVRRGVEVDEAGERAGAQGAGVVDQHVGTAQLARHLGERRAVPLVGDVPGEDGVRSAARAWQRRSWRSSAPRASSTRRQPRRSSSRASARPSPRDAPVITATGMGVLLRSGVRSAHPATSSELEVKRPPDAALHASPPGSCNAELAPTPAPLQPRGSVRNPAGVPPARPTRVTAP